MKEVDIDDLSDMVNMPIVRRSWVNYNLGFGKSEKYRCHTKDSVANYHNYEKKLRSNLNDIINHEWDRCASFWTGFLVFCLRKKPALIAYSDNPKLDENSTIRSCCEELIFPEWSRVKIEKILEMDDFVFEDFVRAAGKIKKIHFDVNSALAVYKLQGDDAILGILSQMFWTGSHGEVYDIILIPDLPIIWKPKVSDFVSGVVFPCVVCPYVSIFEWKKLTNGVFLMAGDEVIDCCTIGGFSLWYTNLGGRLPFFGRGGINKNIICYCWGDIVDAVNQFGGDVLVRSLSENLFDADWHRFGLGGLVSIMCKDGFVYGLNNKNRHAKYIRCQSNNNKKWMGMVMNLDGDRVRVCSLNDVVYSIDEIEDWFELAGMCRSILEL